MKNNTKERLFEVMQRIDKDFVINEAIGGGAQAPIVPAATPNPTSQQPKQPSDVASLARATGNAQTVSKASGYINTAFEFPEAFRLWFSSLGVAKNHAIPKGTILRNVSQILDSMGYK